MAELARKTPTTLLEFMDRVDGFINAEDPLRTLTTSKKTKLEQANQNANGSSRGKALEKPKKEQHDTRRGENMLAKA